VKFATFSRTQRCQHQPGAAEEEASMMVKEALAPTIQLVCMQFIDLFFRLKIMHIFLW